MGLKLREVSALGVFGRVAQEIKGDVTEVNYKIEKCDNLFPAIF